MNGTVTFNYGDTSRFALRVAFSPDPDNGQGATPEDAISWGSFQIWVDGHNLCAHHEEITTYDSVSWYLLPLLEWMADSWDFIFHEERLPNKVEAFDAWHSLEATYSPPVNLSGAEEDRWCELWQNWWDRHSILAARAGGLFPSVFIRRWRDSVELSWGQSNTAGKPKHYRFIEEKGYKRLPPAEVAKSIYSVLLSACNYLHSQLPASFRLRELLAKVNAIKASRPTRRLALLAGLGDTAESMSHRWENIKHEVAAHAEPLALNAAFGIQGDDELVLSGSCHAALMFGSVSPTIGQEDAIKIAKELLSLYSPDGDPDSLADLVEDMPIEDVDGEAWSEGYKLALDLVDKFDLCNDSHVFVDVESLCANLGINIARCDLKERGIRAISVAGPHHKPSILINYSFNANEKPSGIRFTIAHELCHILYDRSRGARLALASGPWAPRDVEKRANAFGAMLLMPPELVRKAANSIDQQLASRDGVWGVSNILKTSFSATLEHLKNIGLVSESERDQINDENDYR